LGERAVSPGGWDKALGEFLLRYDNARATDSSGQAVLDFLQSTYSASADAAGWDRAALDRPMAAARGL
jgi:hypothetical protein